MARRGRTRKHSGETASAVAYLSTAGEQAREFFALAEAREIERLTSFLNLRPLPRTSAGGEEIWSLFEQLISKHAVKLAMELPANARLEAIDVGEVAGQVWAEVQGQWQAFKSWRAFLDSMTHLISEELSIRAYDRYAVRVDFDSALVDTTGTSDSSFEFLESNDFVKGFLSSLPPWLQEVALALRQAEGNKHEAARLLGTDSRQVDKDRKKLRRRWKEWVRVN